MDIGAIDTVSKLVLAVRGMRAAIRHQEKKYDRKTVDIPELGRNKEKILGRGKES